MRANLLFNKHLPFTNVTLPLDIYYYYSFNYSYSIRNNEIVSLLFECILAHVVTGSHNKTRRLYQMFDCP